MLELWELIARESIQDLVTRYNSNGDTGRFTQVLELFADDATMEIEGPDGHVVRRGHDEILTIFTDAQQRWSSPADASPTPYIRHRVATHQIDFTDRNHATGRSYYQVTMAHGLDHWGRYFDTYEDRDGRWLFTSRKVTTEGCSERA